MNLTSFIGNLKSTNFNMSIDNINSYCARPSSLLANLFSEPATLSSASCEPSPSFLSPAAADCWDTLLSGSRADDSLWLEAEDSRLLVFSSL